MHLPLNSVCRCVMRSWVEFILNNKSVVFLAIDFCLFNEHLNGFSLSSRSHVLEFFSFVSYRMENGSNNCYRLLSFLPSLLHFQLVKNVFADRSIYVNCFCTYSIILSFTSFFCAFIQPHQINWKWYVFLHITTTAF